MKLSPLMLAVFCLTLVMPSAFAQEDAPPVRVYILAGQSNMVGQARLSLLDHQINAPQTAETFAYLHEDGQYHVRDDVWIQFGNRRGGLTPGYGGNQRFGVELSLGYMLGNHFDEPVLLIKTAWGGKSLHVDFRPPSAPPFLTEAQMLEQLEQENQNRVADNQTPLTLEDLQARYGHYYRLMLEDIQTTLAELDERFPALAGRDYAISGFVWFQGWNDLFNPRAPAEYQANLTHLINDLRRDLNAPNLPVVVGLMGQNGSSPPNDAMQTIQHAQAAVAELPEFANTVAAIATDVLVDTAAEQLYPSWQEEREQWERTGSDHPYHYYGSPLWHHRIGQAFAQGLLDLEGKG